MPSVEDMTTAAYALEPSPAMRILRQLGRDTQFVLLGFPLGLITVVVSMVGFFLGARPVRDLDRRAAADGAC